MKCSVQNCKNETFENLDKCALHCSNKNINDENKSRYLSKFYQDFRRHIFEKLYDFSENKYKPKNGRMGLYMNLDKKIISNVENLNFNDMVNNVDFVDILKNYKIKVYEINFPVNINSDVNGIINIINKLNKFTFKDCSFLGEWESKKSNMFYERCSFLDRLIIYADTEINESDDFSSKIDIDDKLYRFSECVFNKDVFVKNDESNNFINYNVFNSCMFKGDINLNNIKVAKRLIKIPENKKENGIIHKYIKADIKKRDEINNIFKFQNIIIEKCEFFSKFKLNGVGSYDIDKYIKENSININLEFPKVHIGIFKIEDTKFKSKFELKNSILKGFKFHDSNVEGIFDINESHVIKADFYKSIFEEFAAFGNVIFGDGEESNVTDFMYTTFKDFSSFRDSDFKSGLRFSKANIKQEPNFLNVRIDIDLTDRETLRVIKNSFEKNNNKIESNRFFIYEMFSYRREIIRERKITFSNFSKKNIFIFIFIFIFIQILLCLFLFFSYVIPPFKNYINKKVNSEFKKFIGLVSRSLVVSANYHISRFGESYMKPILLFILSVALYTWILNIHKCIFDEKGKSQPILLIKKFVTQDWFVALSDFLNSCAANVPLFSKALEKKSGIEFISLLFFIWFGILTWQIIVAVKRHTQR